MANYRYGPYDDGPEPAWRPPYDVRGGTRRDGRAQSWGGDNPRGRALPRTCCGAAGRTRRRPRRPDAPRPASGRRELRNAGRLDGMLDQARELLDEALEARAAAALFPDPSDDARLREAELDALPSDTSRAIRQLSDYELAVAGSTAAVSSSCATCCAGRCSTASSRA